MHCSYLWAESVVVFHALPSLVLLPPLSGLALFCFEEEKYEQHSLRGAGKAKKKGGAPKALGAKKSGCLGEVCSMAAS